MSISEKLTTIAENEQKVYEAGRTKEWSDFWDGFQQNGERTSYQYAFSNAWDSKAFKPKHDIKPKDASCMFQNSKITGDLRNILKECNAVLDTSEATYMQNAFNNAWSITHLPEISLESANAYSSRTEGTFMGCYALQHIDKVVLSIEKHQPMTNTFQSCKALTHLRISGPKNKEDEKVIGENFNVSWCPLDTDSVLSILTHLKDYSGDTTGGTYILSLSDTSKTAMAELGAIAELNNKTYTEYLADIGWSLA